MTMRNDHTLRASQHTWCPKDHRTGEFPLSEGNKHTEKQTMASAGVSCHSSTYTHQQGAWPQPHWITFLNWINPAVPSARINQEEVGGGWWSSGKPWSQPVLRRGWAGVSLHVGIENARETASGKARIRKVTLIIHPRGLYQLQFRGNRKGRKVRRRDRLFCLHQQRCKFWTLKFFRKGSSECWTWPE